MKQPIFYWHIHHDVLVEALTEPLKNRIDYIKKNKPKDEIPLRLKCIKRVKGKLPVQFVEANKALVEANKAQVEANKALVEANKACLPQLFKLHKKECGCKFKVSIFDN
jgi:hypothetical protein